MDCYVLSFFLFSFGNDICRHPSMFEKEKKLLDMNSISSFDGRLRRMKQRFHLRKESECVYSFIYFWIVLLLLSFIYLFPIQLTVCGDSWVFLWVFFFRGCLKRFVLFPPTPLDVLLDTFAGRRHSSIPLYL